MSVITFIEHYQRSIEKCQNDEKRLLHCLEKLNGLKVKVRHLQSTGVGRTVNALRKKPGQVGDAAKRLVANWKQIVENHVSSDDEAYDSQSSRQKDSPQQPAMNGHATVSEVEEKDESEALTKKARSDSGSQLDEDVEEHQDVNSSNKQKHHDDSRSRSHEPRDKYKDGHRESSNRDKSHKSSKEKSSEERNGHKKESGREDRHREERSSHRSVEKRGDKSQSESHKSRLDDKNKSSSSRKVSDSKSKETNREGSDKLDSKEKHKKNDRHHSSSSDRHHKHRSRESTSSSSKKTSNKPTSFEDAIALKFPSTSKTSRSHDSKPDYKIKIKHELEDEANEGMLELPVPKFAFDDPLKQKKIKIEKNSEDSDSQAHGSFEQALGFLQYTPTKKKKEVKKEKKKKSVYTLDEIKPLPKSEDLAKYLSLPTPSTAYKPLPQVSSRQPRVLNPEFDPLSSIMSSKTQRTKVYSGVKISNGEIPSLEYMCIKVLQENLDALEYIGWAPYYLMEPILARASASQLANIEHHNPRLTEETDELWKCLVKNEFRGAELQEEECWRDVYERSVEERENKLGNIMERIRQNNEARKAPQRTTKLAFVHSHAKPPRGIIRKQIKHGTSRGSLPAPPPRYASSGDDQPGPSGVSSHASTLARTVGMIREGPSLAIKSKKRPAPLMQKTLKFMKTSYRR